MMNAIDNITEDVSCCVDSLTILQKVYEEYYEAVRNFEQFYDTKITEVCRHFFAASYVPYYRSCLNQAHTLRKLFPNHIRIGYLIL